MRIKEVNELLLKENKILNEKIAKKNKIIFSFSHNLLIELDNYFGLNQGTFPKIRFLGNQKDDEKFYNFFVKLRKYIYIDGNTLKFRVEDETLDSNNDLLKFMSRRNLFSNRELLAEFYSYLTKSVFFKEKNKTNEIRLLENEINLLKQKISAYSSRLTKLSDLSYFIELYTIFKEKAFYYPYFKDFRGRTYSHCPSHPILNRVSRAFIWVEEEKKEDFENEQQTNYYSFLIESTWYLRIKDEGSVNKPQSLKKNKILFYYLNILLIEYFKFYKSLYLIKSESLSIDEVLLFGYECYLSTNAETAFNEKIKLESIDEVFYHEKIKKSIKLLLEEEKIPDIMLNRDSTASFIQHWSYLLIPKNNEILESLNLSGCRLFDYYNYNIKFIRSIALKTIEGYKSDTYIKNYMIIFDYFINRKVVKKPIMTSNYGVTFITSLKYFKLEICNQIEIFIKTNPDIDETTLHNVLDEIHKLLYNYAKNDIFIQMFEKNKEDFLKNLGYSFTYENQTINYKYFKQRQSRTSK